MAAEAVVATWVVAVAASTAVAAATEADTTVAPEVTAAGITEAAPMGAAVTAAGDMADADTPDAATAVPLAPVAQLRPGLGRGKAVVPDAMLLRDGMGLQETAPQAGPERRTRPDGRAVPKLAGRPGTSHLTQWPPTEIGILLAVPTAQL